MEGAVVVPVYCVCCGGPYHPATGGLHNAGLAGTVAFCGPCEKGLVAYVKHVMGRTVSVSEAKKGKRIPYHC